MKRFLAILIMVLGIAFVSVYTEARIRPIHLDVMIMSEPKFDEKRVFNVYLGDSFVDSMSSSSPNKTKKELPGTIHLYQTVHNVNYDDTKNYLKIEYIYDGTYIDSFLFEVQPHNGEIRCCYYFDGKKIKESEE